MSPAIRPSYRSTLVASSAPPARSLARSLTALTLGVARAGSILAARASFCERAPRSIFAASAYATSASSVPPMFSRSAAANRSLHRSSIRGHKRRLMGNLRRFSSLKLESSILPRSPSPVPSAPVRLLRIAHLRVRNDGRKAGGKEGRRDGGGALSLRRWRRWFVAHPISHNQRTRTTKVSSLATVAQCHSSIGLGPPPVLTNLACLVIHIPAASRGSRLF